MSPRAVRLHRRDWRTPIVRRLFVALGWASLFAAAAAAFLVLDGDLAGWGLAASAAGSILALLVAAPEPQPKAKAPPTRIMASGGVVSARTRSRQRSLLVQLLTLPV